MKTKNEVCQIPQRKTHTKKTYNPKVGLGVSPNKYCQVSKKRGMLNENIHSYNYYISIILPELLISFLEWESSVFINRSNKINGNFYTLYFLIYILCVK